MRVRSIGLFLLLCLLGRVALAQQIRMPAMPSVPVTIHDAGGRSLAPYLVDEPEASAAAGARGVPAPPARMPALWHYPVRSRLGAAGRLLKNPTRGRLSGGPGQPFFIIGDDAPSHEWLRLNADSLRKMGAYGVVTSVDSAARLNEMVDSVQIPMAPVSADALFEALGFAVWPVLVRADGMIVQ